MAALGIQIRNPQNAAKRTFSPNFSQPNPLRLRDDIELALLDEADGAPSALSPAHPEKPLKTGSEPKN